jgi:hypothetical protein
MGYSEAYKILCDGGRVSPEHLPMVFFEMEVPLPGVVKGYIKGPNGTTDLSIKMDPRGQFELFKPGVEK